jgi:hypothetical protein
MAPEIFKKSKSFLGRRLAFIQVWCSRSRKARRYMGHGCYHVLLACGHVYPSATRLQSRLTHLLGYTPFDRDTQRQEMEAIMAGDYRFEPGKPLDTPWIALTEPRRGVLG